MKTPGPARTKAPGHDGRLSLRLYVAGGLPASTEAAAMLRALCAAEKTNPPRLEIIDLLQEPKRGMADGIIVTPTLVRLSPQPEVRILGFLSDLARVRSALGLSDDSSRVHE